MTRKQSMAHTLSQVAPELSGARISVFAQLDPVLEDGLRELRRSRAEVVHMWPPTKRISSGMDVLICDYFPKLAEAIPWEPGEPEAALIVLLPHSAKYDEIDICAAAPQGVLQRPCPGYALATATRVAWSQYRYEKRLRDRISKLDDNLRSIRRIERAKLLMMTQKGLDEAAAYRTLRQMAMKRRISIVNLAEAVLRREEFDFSREDESP